MSVDKFRVKTWSLADCFREVIVALSSINKDNPTLLHLGRLYLYSFVFFRFQNIVVFPKFRLLRNLRTTVCTGKLVCELGPPVAIP